MASTIFAPGVVVASPWLNDVNANTYETTGGKSARVSSISALRSVVKTSGASVFVTGYLTPGDGGGGWYYYNPTDTTTLDNGGSTIVAADGGRWNLVTYNAVNASQFGADKSGTLDAYTAITNAITYCAATGKQLIFSAGTYKYSVAPNFGITNLDVKADGIVLFKHTGTGNSLVFDAGSSVGQRNYNIKFRGNFYVEGNATSSNGVYVRSIHHSQIEARVQGAGPTYSAFRVEFAVCSEFWFIASGNERVIGTSTPAGAGIGFVLGCNPKYGIYLTARNAFEQVSDCVFHDPIIEGVTSDGIYCFGAIMNKFIGGTSEANGGRGVYTSNSDNATYPTDPVRAKDFASLYNLFFGLDMEVNTGGDVSENGIGNLYYGCYSDSTFTATNISIRVLVIGGTYNNVVDQGTASKYRDVNYANNAGTFTRGGTQTVITSVWNNTGGYYIEDQVQTTVGPTTVTGTVSGTPTTVITLPSSATPVAFVSIYQIHAYIPGGVGDPNNYVALMTVAVDTGVARILSNISGTKMVLSMSGLNVQATQTSGAPASITCKAIRM